jgi:tetratricopeptide (TPR) repeat protein
MPRKAKPNEIAFKEEFEKGYNLYELGRYEEALDAFDRVTEINPKELLSWHNKGVVLTVFDRYEDALDAFNKAIEIDPLDAESWYGKGTVFDRLGRYEEALDAFNKAIKIDPKEALPWFSVGFVLDELGRQEESLDAFNNAIELDPLDYAAWFGKGSVLGSLGKYEEALDAFVRVIEIDPLSSQAWYYKGVMLDRLFRYEEALDAFDKAIEIDPLDVESWNGKGTIFGRLGKYKEALAAFDQAILIYPERITSWHNEGIILYRLSMYKEALNAFNKAIEIDPTYALAYSNLAETQFTLGYISEAEDSVTKALELCPELVPALLLKGEIEIEKKQYFKADQFFNRAISIDIGNPLLILWTVYAQYLEIESSFHSDSKVYKEEIFRIITKLERVNKIISRLEYEDRRIRAYILYFLGFLYYKAKDLIKVKKTLIECINLKSGSSEQSAAKELLNNFWDYVIRPPWWRWWLFSPLNTWLKRSIFSVISFAIVTLCIIQPFIPAWFPGVEINLAPYVVLALLLVIVLFWPNIESIRAGGVEITLRSEPIRYIEAVPPSLPRSNIKIELQSVPSIRLIISSLKLRAMRSVKKRKTRGESNYN